MLGVEVGNIRLETIGSPALGHGSNCKLLQLANLWASIKSLLAWGRCCHSGEFELDLQGIFQMLVNFHYSSLVTASVAVVWCCKVVATLV
jgi:hypothetical protein